MKAQSRVPENIGSSPFSYAAAAPSAGPGAQFSADIPRGNLINGALAGTTGTKTTGGTATMTGNVATGWTLANSAPVQEGTAAVTAAKVNRTSAQGTVIGEWQQVSLAGNTTSTPPQFITFSRNLTAANFAQGDLVQAIGEIEWDSNLVGVRSIFLGFNVPGTYESRSFDPLDATTPLATGLAMSGVHCTDQVLMPASFSTVQARVVIQLQEAFTGVAGTIRFGNLGARKLV